MTNYFNSLKENNFIINLACKEFSNVISNTSLNSIVLECIFYEKSNNSLNVIGNYSKAARGTMANFIVKNKLERIKDLEEFSELGYNFSSEKSNNNKLVFIR